MKDRIVFRLGFLAVFRGLRKDDKVMTTMSFESPIW